MTKKSIIQSIKEECFFPISDEVVELFISNCHTVKFKKNEPIVEEGMCNSSLYVIKKGNVRLSYRDLNKEIIYGFAGPGTFTLSPHSFCKHEGAFFTYHALNSVEALCMSEETLMKLLHQSHEFAIMLFYICMWQFDACEMKAQMLSGSAKDNYKSLQSGLARKRYAEFQRNHPDLISSVTSKMLASYLGINETYLSRIKREIIEEDKDDSNQQ